MLKVVHLPFGGSLEVWISTSAFEGCEEGGVVGKVVGSILLNLGMESVPCGSIEEGSHIGDLEVIAGELRGIDGKLVTSAFEEPRELEMV